MDAVKACGHVDSVKACVVKACGQQWVAKSTMCAHNCTG